MDDAKKIHQAADRLLKCDWSEVKQNHELLNGAPCTPDLLKEWVRFFAIKATFDSPVIIPPPAIENIWRTVLLMPRTYIKLCAVATGKPKIVDHEPLYKNISHPAIFTHMMYCKIYREYPCEEIWPNYCVPNVEINVKTLTGKIYKVRLHSSENIRDLKREITSQAGFCHDMMKLFFKGNQLADESIIADIGITEGSTVILIIRLGGC